MIKAVFKYMCPNCHGDIDSERLLRGLPCRRCLPEGGELKGGDYERIRLLWKELEEFEKFFREKVGSDLWPIQRTWAVRLLLDRSFALLAPTGIGKTTFGLVASSFLARRGQRSYLIFPTTALLEQAAERLLAWGVEEKDILAYGYKNNVSTPKRKEEFMRRMESGDFLILLSTTMFLYRNSPSIPKGIYSFVFVDDVDSILKTAKNIDKVLELLGFSDEDIRKTLSFIARRAKLLREGEFEEISERHREIEEIAKKRKGVLVVSSATSNPRSQRVRLFRELLGFEVERPSLTLRNIEDVYERVEEEKLWEISLRRIKELGRGGLIFLSSSQTKEKLQEYVKFLQERGIKAASYEDLGKVEEDFKRGEIEVLVGFASYRNPLARGIDLPETIRYALFVGVPKLQFHLRIGENYTHLYYLLLSLVPFLMKKGLVGAADQRRLYNYLDYLRRYAFIPLEQLEEYPPIQHKFNEIQSYVSQLLGREEIFEEVRKSPEIGIEKAGEDFILTVADITGYIQASGRTSRLFAGGLTKGLSLILVEDEKAFYNLRKKVKLFGEEITFKEVGEADLNKILKEVDEDREKVRKVRRGEGIEEARHKFKTALVIVESPNKARTISSFFGRPLRRQLGNLEAYEMIIGDKFITIVASKGHVFDLNKEEGFYGVLRENGVLVPIYEPIDPERQKIVESLQGLGLEVEEIYIATDPDTEGEKIGFDISLALRPFVREAIKRAEFHEVTKKAFREALENAREIDENLVKAQIVRRVADRLIGFSISREIQREFGKAWLSAGRVQTPVLEWIIKRTDEARKKIAVVEITVNGTPFNFKFEDIRKARDFHKDVKEIEIREERRWEEDLHVAPFCTFSMLREASNKLKFPPQKTMQLAQDLFEAGFITYHRTDSIRVSDEGVRVAAEYIKENFGEEYLKPRTFAAAGGAHECIRPTKPMDEEELRASLYTRSITNITEDHLKLYNLIFKQFIASQMRETRVEKGLFAAFSLGEEAREEFNLRIVQDGCDRILPVRTFHIAPGRYHIEEGGKSLRVLPASPLHTFASVIEEMKRKGIGRPSTYAETLEKLLERRYIISKRGYLIATKLGKEVLRKIKENEEMAHFVSEDYTRELEEIMDRVERGEEAYEKVLRAEENPYFGLFLKEAMPSQA